MKILGIAAPFGHDHSAALLIDGKIVAAAEEERFTRKKHAVGQKPVSSIRFCLEKAGITPEDVDYIAYPWSFNALRRKRFEYFRRTLFSNPGRAYKKFFRNSKEFNNQNEFINTTLKDAGFDLSKTKIEWVEHHVAHASSSLYLSGFGDAAVMSIDGGGEITATLLGYTENNAMKIIKEIIAPDSLGLFYSTMTDYLGFRRENREYKVMGMAPYGDSGKADFSNIIWWDNKTNSYHCNDDYVWARRKKRFRVDKVYSKKMVREFGPERDGDGLSEPYVHIAAATQKKLEEIVLRLVEVYLKQKLQECGNLCFAGGVALNVALNRVLLEQPYIKNLWVQPASHDSGTSLGAAIYIASQLGDEVEPMEDVYLGPEFSNKDIEDELKKWNFPFNYEDDVCRIAADLLNKGKVVGWFHDRMEWGPRSLGNRSILGNPTIRGIADKINEQIKFREKWRPFCPSILEEYTPEILNSNHPAPFMTMAFRVNSEWSKKIPEVVHVDGTCRPQVVERDINPRFYEVIDDFRKRSGVPVVINTSLNRKGEPIVCAPYDALTMFKGSGLKYLVMGDFLVRK